VLAKADARTIERELVNDYGPAPSVAFILISPRLGIKARVEIPGITAGTGDRELSRDEEEVAGHEAAKGFGEIEVTDGGEAS
jgi:hypothetical protein